MDTPLVFARHFAHLVWMFLRDPGSTYEQQTVLASLAAAARDAEVSLTLNDEGLRANGALVPAELTGVGDLTRQMMQHGLAMISADAGATEAELYGVAGIIAAMPVMDDGGAAAEANRREIGVRTIRFAARSRIRAELAPLEPRDSRMLTSFPDLELGEMLAPLPPDVPENPTPGWTRAIDVMPASPFGARPAASAHFTAPLTPRESLDDLLKQFDAEQDPVEISRLLGDLATIAEDAAHAGRATIACRVMTHMARREPQIEDDESRRACGLTLSRLGRADVVRVIASQMPRYPDSRNDFVGVLGRAGDNGTEAMIEQLMRDDHQKDRRVYFDALLQLNAGVPSLLHMLEDTRWFVVRNAAELLGEMRVVRAERQLTDLQKHPDERVNRAAKTALMRLGTPRSMMAIENVFKSGDTQFRIEAANALVTRKDGRSTPALLLALEGERDAAVQVALLGALGKVATPEAVQRLVKCAEPDRSLFRKRTTDFRVAATHALADAGTPEALDALRVLQADKEPDVRAAAKLSLGRATRRATMSVQSIPL